MERRFIVATNNFEDFIFDYIILWRLKKGEINHVDLMRYLKKLEISSYLYILNSIFCLITPKLVGSCLYYIKKTLILISIFRIFFFFLCFCFSQFSYKPIEIFSFNIVIYLPILLKSISKIQKKELLKYSLNSSFLLNIKFC